MYLLQSSGVRLSKQAAVFMQNGREAAAPFKKLLPHLWL